MTKKKKKNKNKKEILINVLVILGFAAAMFVGYIAAKHVTEKKIAKYASSYMTKLNDALKFVCHDIDYENPNKKVKYSYVINCYYSEARSQYNASSITMDNNGIIRQISYKIPAETNQSKEDNYTNIEDIMKRTNEAIGVSGADLSKIKMSNSMLETFKIGFSDKTLEQKSYVNEADDNYIVKNAFYPQDDETPYIPSYFEIDFIS